MDGLPHDCIRIILEFCERNNNAAFLAMTCRAFYQLAQLCKIDIRFRWTYCSRNNNISLDLFNYFDRKIVHRIIVIWVETANIECLKRLPDSPIFHYALRLSSSALDECPHLFNDLEKYIPNAQAMGNIRFLNWFLLRYYERNGYDKTLVLMNNYSIRPLNHTFSQELVNIFAKSWSIISPAMFAKYSLPDKHTLVNCPQLPYYYMPLNEIPHGTNEKIFIDLERWDAVVFLLNKPSVSYYFLWMVIEIEEPAFYALITELAPQTVREILNICILFDNYKHFAFWRALLPPDAKIKYSKPKYINTETPFEVCQQIGVINYCELKDIIRFGRCDLFEYYIDIIKSNFSVSKIWDYILEDMNYHIMKLFFKLFFSCGATKEEFSCKAAQRVPMYLSEREIIYMAKFSNIDDLLRQAILYKYYTAIEILFAKVAPDTKWLHVVCMHDNWIMYKMIRHQFTDEEKVYAIHGAKATYIASLEAEMIARIHFV